MAQSNDYISPSVKLDDSDPSPDFFRITFITDGIRVAKKTTCCFSKAVIANGSVTCDIQTRSVQCNVEAKDDSGKVVRYVSKYELPKDIIPVESNYKTKNGMVIVYLKKKETESWVPHISQIREVSADRRD